MYLSRTEHYDLPSIASAIGVPLNIASVMQARVINYATHNRYDEEDYMDRDAMTEEHRTAMNDDYRSYLEYVLEGTLNDTEDDPFWHRQRAHLYASQLMQFLADEHDSPHAERLVADNSDPRWLTTPSPP